LKVMRFVFIVEAWVVRMPEQVATNEAGPPWPRPSEHPDRREVVKIKAEDHDGSALSGMYYILRPEHGPATLSPFHEDHFTSVAGRLTGVQVRTSHLDEARGRPPHASHSLSGLWGEDRWCNPCRGRGHNSRPWQHLGVHLLWSHPGL